MARFYRRPSPLRRRFYDPFVRMVVMRTGWSGFGGDRVQVLAVQGRRTGRWYRHPVGVCTLDGQRYLVSFYGDSEWARNVRAGMATQMESRGSVEPVRAVELTGQARVEFMAFLVDRYPLLVRVWMKVRPKRITAVDLELLASRYPVFRLHPA